MKIKSLLSILVSVVMLLSFIGCESKTKTDDAMDEKISNYNTSNEKDEDEITLADYEVAGAQNVEYVNYLYIGEIDGVYKAQKESAENANYISVGTVCPHCNNKQEYRYEISKILNEDIGKDTIFKTGSGKCMGAYHSSSYPNQYTFSYAFTLVQ